jgi:hypothetical protein
MDLAPNGMLLMCANPLQGLNVISQGPKMSRFLGPNSPPTFPSNGFASIKSIMYRAYQSEVHQ